MAVKIADLFVNIGGNLTGLTNALNRVEGKLKKTGDKFKRIGTDMTLGLTAPIIGFSLAIGKAASSFESSFA